MAHRIQAYRARRGRLRPDDSQAALPFAENLEPQGPFSGPSAEERAAVRTAARPRRVERVEIAVNQPELDFSRAEDFPIEADPQLVPIAGLRERVRAGLLDAAFLLLAYGGFLALFRSLGGQFSFGKADAAVYAVTFFLFYALYFILFSAFGGSTPGMQFMGLGVVSFDGSTPSARQLLWRSFGYVVAGGTLSLGFLWSLWDEDHLTWQDRISQTYLTRVQVVTESQQPLAPK